MGGFKICEAGRHPFHHLLPGPSYSYPPKIQLDSTGEVACVTMYLSVFQNLMYPLDIPGQTSKLEWGRDPNKLTVNIIDVRSLSEGIIDFLFLSMMAIGVAVRNKENIPG